MDQIPNKFPSIYNSQYYNEINVKLYNEIPYREIARWLKDITECEEDCISQSRIGDYARYVKERGGFKQLLSQEILEKEDIQYSQLFQKAINVSYQQLDELTGQNLVNLIKTIFQYSLPMHINLTTDTVKKHETDSVVLEELLDVIQDTTN